MYVALLPQQALIKKSASKNEHSIKLLCCLLLYCFSLLQLFASMFWQPKDPCCREKWKSERLKFLSDALFLFCLTNLILQCKICNMCCIWIHESQRRRTVISRYEHPQQLYARDRERDRWKEK